MTLHTPISSAFDVPVDAILTCGGKGGVSAYMSAYYAVGQVYTLCLNKNDLPTFFAVTPAGVVGV